MKLNSLSCNHCGAPLEVRQNTRFATCEFCYAKLEVHREGNAVFSEVLEAINKKTDQIADDVARLRLNSELEQIDRQWTTQQERFMVRNRDQQLRVPSKEGGYFAIFASVLIGVIILVVSATSGASPPFVLFAILLIGVGIVGGMLEIAKANDYEQNRKRYQRQRLDVLRKFDEK